MWCVPTLDGEFITRMNDVLDLYERPYDPRLPVVCLDEKSVELHDEKYPSRRDRKGIVRRDHEYVRRGTANIFVMTEPKGGRHFGRVTSRRRRREFAETLRFLSLRYPDAVTIHLVMDNLNTHTEKSLIETFGDVAGRRLWARFTVHYTPKHASWLNQAEIAIQVMTRCALGKERIGSLQAVRDRVTPFWAQRRRERWTIDWRFNRKNAQRWLKSFSNQH